MSKNALTVENLTKIYLNSKSKKENKALNNLTFDVKEGEVFGLLGPNGAGKTTFLSILGGTVIKSSGDVNVWGFDLDKNPRQVRASLGIVPQEVNLDAFFSPKKLLELQAGLYEFDKESLDDLTKSVANDPTYTARVSSFTQNLRNEALDANQFYPDQKQSSNNFGNLLLKFSNQYPLIRVLTGLHFVKTPVSLFKYGWQMTPMLNKLNMEYRAMRLSLIHI